MITKKEARKHFEGSARFFEACWRELNTLGQDYFDDSRAALEQIASEKVNNPRSSFYIYGK